MKTKLPYESTGKAIKGYTDSLTAKTETNDCVVRAFASAFDVMITHISTLQKNLKDNQGEVHFLPHLRWLNYQKV